MNRTRQILKKAVVTAMGASLVVSGSSTVFAAGSYQETEKAALNKLTDGIPETWDTYLENYKKSAAGSLQRNKRHIYTDCRRYWTGTCRCAYGRHRCFLASEFYF